MPKFYTLVILSAMTVKSPYVELFIECVLNLYIISENVHVFLNAGFSGTSLNFFLKKIEHCMPQVSSSVSISLEDDGWGNANVFHCFHCLN